MRTFITVFLIVAFIAGLGFCDHYFVYNFCTQLSQSIKSLEGLSDESAIRKNNDIIKLWNKKRNGVYIFANHRSFEEIEDGIYGIKYNLSAGNLREAQIRVRLLYQKICALKEENKFSLANLL